MKNPLAIRIDKELFDRIDQRVAADVRFHDRTHFIVVACSELLDKPTNPIEPPSDDHDQSVNPT